LPLLRGGAGAEVLRRVRADPGGEPPPAAGDAGPGVLHAGAAAGRGRRRLRPEDACRGAGAGAAEYPGGTGPGPHRDAIIETLDTRLGKLCQTTRLRSW